MGNVNCSSCSLTEDELNEVKVEPKYQEAGGSQTSGAQAGGAQAGGSQASGQAKNGLPSTPQVVKPRTGPQESSSAFRQAQTPAGQAAPRASSAAQSALPLTAAAARGPAGAGATSSEAAVHGISATGTASCGERLGEAVTKDEHKVTRVGSSGGGGRVSVPPLLLPKAGVSPPNSPMAEPSAAGHTAIPVPPGSFVAAAPEPDSPAPGRTQEAEAAVPEIPKMASFVAVAATGAATDVGKLQPFGADDGEDMPLLSAEVATPLSAARRVPVVPASPEEFGPFGSLYRDGARAAVSEETVALAGELLRTRSDSSCRAAASPSQPLISEKAAAEHGTNTEEPRVATEEPIEEITASTVVKATPDCAQKAELATAPETLPGSAPEENKAPHISQEVVEEIVEWSPLAIAEPGRNIAGMDAETTGEALEVESEAKVSADDAAGTTDASAAAEMADVVKADASWFAAEPTKNGSLLVVAQADVGVVVEESAPMAWEIPEPDKFKEAVEVIRTESMVEKEEVGIFEDECSASAKVSDAETSVMALKASDSLHGWRLMPSVGTWLMAAPHPTGMCLTELVTVRAEEVVESAEFQAAMRIDDDSAIVCSDSSRPVEQEDAEIIGVELEAGVSEDIGTNAPLTSDSPSSQGSFMAALPAVLEEHEHSTASEEEKVNCDGDTTSASDVTDCAADGSVASHDIIVVECPTDKVADLVVDAVQSDRIERGLGN